MSLWKNLFAKNLIIISFLQMRWSHER
jgi:hypothetical protein